MTLYSSIQGGEMSEWVRSTLVDHWLKGVVPAIVVAAIVMVIVLGYPVQKAGVIATFGITVGWLAAGLLHNIADIREVRD